MRLSFWLAGTLLGRGLRVLPAAEPRHWPLPTGLGGVIGDAMLRVPATGVRPADRRRSCSQPPVRVRRLHAGRGRDRHRLRLSRSVGRQARRALGARGRGPRRTTTRSATSISLGWLVHAAAEPQGAHRPAGDAPLGAACAEPSPPRADAGGVAARPHRAARSTQRPTSRRRGRDRGRRRRRRSRRPRASRRAQAAPKRSSGGYQLPALDAARPPPKPSTGSRRARNRSRRPPRRSKACSATSACAARSSTRGPARWSRSTSSSPRPASSRRA